MTLNWQNKSLDWQVNWQLNGARIAALLPIFLAFASCTYEGSDITGLSTFVVTVTKVNGAAPPAEDAPLPANRGDKDEAWEVTIEPRNGLGEPVSFDGMVRLSVEPGAVVGVTGDGAQGRNILIKGGKATAEVLVTAVYGATRLWVEDVGYVPAQVGAQPACADGLDDDGDVLIDFPADPGCAFANDDTEAEGTFAAGVSRPVAYQLPTIRDIQGDGATTPYPFEGMQVNTEAGHEVVVTRVSSDGFYVTDISEQDKGYNSLFAFNFNTPAGMRVCDKVAYLAGTVNEFFGFTELSFPSYRLIYPHEGDKCDVPEPTVLSAAMLVNDETMEKLESGLARVHDYAVAKNFGPKPAHKNIFLAEQSNCDLNGDGQVDFDSPVEASCGNACSFDPDCSEWTGFAARGNFKIRSTVDGGVLQANLGTVPLFNPTEHKGEVIASITGTLRNFSGGSLNWTIETRCPEDLVCSISDACAAKELLSSDACVRLRSIDDNDQGTN
jgi:hypothetical protein